MTENQLQEQTAQLIRHLGWLGWHTPNENSQRLSRAGVLPGVSDWFIAEPWELDGRRGFGMAIELKVGANTTSPAQDRFLAQASARGVLTAVCRSYDEFVSVLRAARPANGRRMP